MRTQTWNNRTMQMPSQQPPPMCTCIMHGAKIGESPYCEVHGQRAQQLERTQQFERDFYAQQGHAVPEGTYPDHTQAIHQQAPQYAMQQVDRTMMGGQPAIPATSPRTVRYFTGAEFQLQNAQQWEQWLATQPTTKFVRVAQERDYGNGWKLIGMLLQQEGQRRKGEFVVIAEVFRR